jgi:competence protein ComEA
MVFNRRDWLAIGLGISGGAAVLAGASLAVITLLSAASTGSAVPLSSGSLAAAGGSTPAPPAADLLIDVQGAVKRPGVVLLPPGSRVSDALLAAGGYSPDADLNAAAASLNLAAPLADGAQVYVPVLGVAAEPGGGGGGGSTAGGGLVNLNTATPEELEALPGIGPVTVQKIVAAREAQTLHSLEEMVELGVIDRGQLEDIRDLVTF